LSRVVTLGGKEYPLGDFTLGQVSKLSVLLKNAGDSSTQPQADAQTTIIHIGLQSGGYTGTYQEFLNIPGVTIAEIILAKLEIGKAVGFYLDKELAPGEASGEESPSAT
jgi:hypothetical protein